MSAKPFIRLLLLPILLISAAATIQASPVETQPSIVKIITADGGYSLTVNGKPFFINGAGGTRYPDKLVTAGGNSMRTWQSSEADLDTAREHGLMVSMGLRMKPVRHGGDYGDDAFLEKQRQQIIDEVERLKNHPALLIWGIGNEVEHEADAAQTLLVWKEIERIAQTIKKIDINHPVITVLAGTGRKLEDIKRMCPSLDAVGINSYGMMKKVPSDLQKYGWEKPYLITEFGPRGWWEVKRTSWGLPIEDTSTEKAAFYGEAYTAAVSEQSRCLGSYVFLWGNKQEKTHTWFCLFLPDGRATEMVDTMTKMWTGQWPENRAPQIGKKEIYAADGNSTHVYAPASEVKFVIDAKDPENDAIRYEWDLRKDESDNPATGGDWERPIPAIDGSVIAVKKDEVTIRMPKEAGHYRLFAYVSDNSDKVATANLPIKIESPKTN